VTLAEKLDKYRAWMCWLAENASLIPREAFNDGNRDAFAMLEDILNDLPGDLRPSSTTPPGHEVWPRAPHGYDPYKIPFTPWVKHASVLPVRLSVAGLTVPFLAVPIGVPVGVAPLPGGTGMRPPTPYQFPTTTGGSAALDDF
jgi:hypothetical protein